MTHLVELEKGKNVSNLVVSDGSNKVYVVSPVDWSLRRTYEVFDNDKPLEYLNELEFVNNKLYANIYLSKKIAVINLEGNIGKVER